MDVTSEKIANVIKTGGTAVGIFKLIRGIIATVIISVIILFLTFKLNLPWYVPTIAIALCITMDILQIITIRRIRKALL